MKEYYVYILRNKSGTFYTGMTHNLTIRVLQHKNKMTDGFTAKYNINMLIYFEQFNDVNEAIAREKQIKNWNRKKKVFLIKQKNPSFQEIKID